MLNYCFVLFFFFYQKQNVKKKQVLLAIEGFHEQESSNIGTRHNAEERRKKCKHT